VSESEDAPPDEPWAGDERTSQRINTVSAADPPPGGGTPEAGDAAGALPPPEPVRDPTAAPAASRPINRVYRSRERILAGVAGGLAEIFGVSPVWTRLAFVVLGLFGGLGVVAYLAGFLLLPNGPYGAPPSTGRRLLGVAVLPFWLAIVSGDSWGWPNLGRPATLFVLLVGVALALWKPREAAEPGARPLPPPAPRTTVEPSSAAVTTAPIPAAGARPSRARPARSPLGRVCFGVALVVAAVGLAITRGSPTGVKIILAIAALVCAAGLVVGVRYGRARWLVVPGILFATGSVFGAATEGLGVHQSWSNTTTAWSSQDRVPSPPPTRIDQGGGDVQLEFDQTDHPINGVIRLGHGDVVIRVADTVHLQIHARVGIGKITTPGSTTAGYRRAVTYSTGPASGPLVRYDIAVGYGTVEVGPLVPIEPPPKVPVEPAVPLPPGAVGTDRRGMVVYPDGTRQLPDGTIVLPDGTQVMRDGSRVLGPGARLLPDGTVLLPDGTSIAQDGTVHLPDGVVVTIPTTVPATTVPATPSTTVPPPTTVASTSAPPSGGSTTTSGTAP
jgi:phage shock protein PspC (stress-responsive transcriptional regulator)